MFLAESDPDAAEWVSNIKAVIKSTQESAYHSGATHTTKWSMSLNQGKRNL